MKHLVIATLAAGLLVGATPTLADQVANDHTATSHTDKDKDKAKHKADMKACMEKMEAKDKDKTMSHETMKKACHEQYPSSKHNDGAKESKGSDDTHK